MPPQTDAIIINQRLASDRIRRPKAVTVFFEMDRKHDEKKLNTAVCLSTCLVDDECGNYQ